LLRPALFDRGHHAALNRRRGSSDRRRRGEVGRHLALPETPMTDLRVTLLTSTGASIRELGGSTGPLDLEPVPEV